MAFIMDRFGRETHALLRIVAGLLFACHGASKWFGFPAPASAEAPAFVIYLGGGIELVGGLLVAVGLFTRQAAFLCSGELVDDVPHHKAG